MTRISLYSLLPIEPVDVQVALAAHRANQDRNRFPILPWDLEDLAGSLWRNLPTGSLRQVVEVISGPGGRRYPSFASDYMGASYGPGFWWGDRYVIELWIRVDHWPLPEQLAWFGVELAHHRQAIRRYEERLAALNAHPERVSMAAQNRKMRQEELSSEQNKLQQAVKRMQQFAAQHGLEVSLDLLNSGLLQEDTPPVQMMLF